MGAAMWDDDAAAGARRREEVAMWWIALAVGVVSIAIGMVQLVRSFVAGAERGRGLTASGPAIRLVSAAMFVTAGLFVTFFSIANLVALGLVAP
jgi:hypothetical protein